jgi:hypothetical protein
MSPGGAILGPTVFSSLDEQAKHELRLSQIQEQIARGEYQVDAQAVANAIVRRLLQHHRLIGYCERDPGPPDQAECS